MVRPESRLPDDDRHVEALQTTNPEEGPLAGVSVVDLTHFLAGPYASLCLAEMGASITKVEDPERPDEARLVGPHFLGGESLYFLSLNWAKESLAVRLSSDRGRKTLLRVVADADVVLDNFRPGVMEKLGLGHEQLREANPQIVSCSLSGYGDTGPYREQPGYDYTIQALSGVMSLTGEPDGPPGKAGISYVDHAAGLAAGMAVCAALVGRGRGSGGRHIDMSLLDVQISMLSYVAAWGLNGGSLPAREQSGAHPSIVPAQTFATRDGHVSVFVGNDEIWGRLVGVLAARAARTSGSPTGRAATGTGASCCPVWRHCSPSGRRPTSSRRSESAESRAPPSTRSLPPSRILRSPARPRGNRAPSGLRDLQDRPGSDRPCPVPSRGRSVIGPK